MAQFLKFEDINLYRKLKGILSNNGFEESEILNRLGVPDFPSLKGTDIPVLLCRTGSGTPIDTLIRLFLIEVPCTEDDAGKAFAPIEISTLTDAGVLEYIEHGMVEAGIKILPHRGLFISFDKPSILLTDKKEEYVMGIGSSTLTLANITVRKECGNALDLGCGCGYHALLAASHSGRVYASDINERALKFARFNAALNGFDNIECVNGSLFEPFAGIKFDLIVTNPPFVISPERRYIYRDGGMAGDELCRRIAGQAPEYLSDGGWLQMLCNWAEHEGKDWRETLSEWFAGSGCSAWVMRSESRAIEVYASTWIKHTEKDDNRNFAGRFESWINYYKGLGIGTIGAGIISMKKTQKQETWMKMDEAPEKMLGPCGRYVEQAFDAFDFLSAADDEALLRTKFQLSENARLERVCAPAPEGWADESINLTVSTGLKYSGSIDPVMSNMLILCDGTKTLAQLLEGVSSAAGVPAENLQQGFCNMIREMAAKGFLTIQRS